jgi:hypothetical protein
VPIEFNMTPPPTLKPDSALRATLLDYYIANATSPELAQWLKDMGQDSAGSRAEKAARVRAHTKYLIMPVAGFPQQTIHYLEQYSSDHLGAICEALGLAESGTKEDRWRRVMREVALRERWLVPRTPIVDEIFTLHDVLPFIQWHTVLKRGKYEQDFYDGFFDDMTGFFGQDFVHGELPVASGTALRIDFHLGHPRKEGVGVEFKMPTSNSEIQKALGQIDMYLARYTGRLVVVLLPDYLSSTQVQLFLESLATKDVPVLVK